MQTNAPLHSIASGENALVVALRGKESQCKRLEDLGILPGTEVEILANNGGPVLLAVGESRIALESDVAACVLVV